jgi:hypothetical protein
VISALILAFKDAHLHALLRYCEMSVFVYGLHVSISTSVIVRSVDILNYFKFEVFCGDSRAQRTCAVLADAAL